MPADAVLTDFAAPQVELCARTVWNGAGLARERAQVIALSFRAVGTDVPRRADRMLT